MLGVTVFSLMPLSQDAGTVQIGHEIEDELHPIDWCDCNEPPPVPQYTPTNVPAGSVRDQKPLSPHGAFGHLHQCASSRLPHSSACAAPHSHAPDFVEERLLIQRIDRQRDKAHANDARCLSPAPSCTAFLEGLRWSGRRWLATGASLCRACLLAAIHRAFAGCKKRFPLNALRICDPALFALGVTARGRAVFADRAFRPLQAFIDLGQLRPVLDLDAQMSNARLGAAFTDREIHPRIFEHPPGVIVFHDDGLGSEQRSIESDGLFEIVDADMDVKALHAVLRVLRAVAGRSIGAGAHFEPQSTDALPAQQFSVR